MELGLGFFFPNEELKDTGVVYVADLYCSKTCPSGVIKKKRMALNPGCRVYIRNSLHSDDEDGGWCIFSTMSSVFLRDVGGLAPFDCSDTAGVSA